MIHFGTPSLIVNVMLDQSFNALLECLALSFSHFLGAWHIVLFMH